jgi:hypothetical protein
MNDGTLADVAIGIATGGGAGLVRRMAEAAGSRAQLEKARDELVRRLERRSDDYEASIALELVEKALALRPPVEGFEAVVGYNPKWDESGEGGT